MNGKLGCTGLHKFHVAVILSSGSSCEEALERARNAHQHLTLDDGES
jgi:hypothetical protein